MDVPVEEVYQPPPGFVEDKKDPLIDINLTDSATELWLIQWPINQTPDFDGREVSLKLNSDGHLGTFEGSSGKSYEAISFKSQGPEAVVFVISESEAKIAGKISRRVSLIHYPEPSELPKRNSLNLSQSQRPSAVTSTLSGRRMATPTRSTRPPSKSQTRSGYSTPSSRNRSSLSGPSETPKPPKRKRIDEQSHSGQDSGKGNSAVTSTGSFEHSEERRSKKKKEIGH